MQQTLKAARKPFLILHPRHHHSLHDDGVLVAVHDGRLASSRSTSPKAQADYASVPSAPSAECCMHLDPTWSHSPGHLLQRSARLTPSGAVPVHLQQVPSTEGSNKFFWIPGSRSGKRCWLRRIYAIFPHRASLLPLFLYRQATRIYPNNYPIQFPLFFVLFCLPDPPFSFSIRVKHKMHPFKNHAYRESGRVARLGHLNH